MEGWLVLVIKNSIVGAHSWFSKRIKYFLKRYLDHIIRKFVQWIPKMHIVIEFKPGVLSSFDKEIE